MDWTVPESPVDTARVVPIRIGCPRFEAARDADTMGRHAARLGGVTSATHATIAVFSMDLSREDDQRRGLHEMIVPGVRATAGVVSGYWTLDRQSAQSTVVVTFDSAVAAQQFAENVRGNAANQQAAGVTLQSIRVMEVLAAI